MILTCPECATSYFVDDARIPPAGRTVKCASCGARWIARREEDPLDALATAEPAAPEAEIVAAPPAAETAFDDIEAVPREPPALRPRPAAASKAAPPRNDGRATALLWAGMAATVAVVIGGAIVFRQDVVRLWPKSSAAYQGLGLKVNGTGLVIESVKAEPDFLGGRPVLAVSGAIRNLRDEATLAPALRISLLSRTGKPVSAKIARPIDAHIPGHGTRHFAIAILDPPANIHDLEVAFEGPETRTAQAAPPAAAAVPTPAPVDAQPLPPNAPEALPNHG